MKRHEQPSAASYVNWIGRTVVQIHEEQALHRALVDHLQNGAAPASDGESPVALHDRLVSFVDAEQQAGRLPLTPEAPTPLGWRLRNAIDKIGVPIALLVLAPFLLIASPLLVYQLRSREKADPEIAPRPEGDYVRRAAEIEDYDITNQFTVFGDIKPGRFRLWTTMFLLWLLNYSTRHIFNRGYLTRVRTIHFARWVLMNDRKRAFFASNYDGSVESYMDDFINRVAWGINLVFSNFVGLPADGLADQAWRKERAGLQAPAPAAPAADRRLVQCLSGSLGGRSRAQHPDPQGHRAQGDHRQGGEGMAEPSVRAAAVAVPDEPAGIDFGDMQGLVRFGHGRLKEACFLLLKVADPEAARRWLQNAPVTSALKTDPPPDTALQVAFTREGLEELGVPEDVVRGFSEEFLAGMAADASRSRRLGDVGANAPSEWLWGGRPDCVPHVLVMLYAREGGLEAWAEAVKGRRLGCGVQRSRPASTPSTWARSSRSASSTG